jgi:branched-chain amino acid aminotransferase
MATAPFDDRDGKVWFDGELIPWRDGKIHFLTHALHYASSVFEGMRAYDGEFFKLNEHNERLINSADILGFEIPYSLEQINQACRDTLAEQGLSDAYARPVAWRGTEMMGVAAQQTKIHLAIACWAWPSYFLPEALLKGLKLNIADWRRPAPDTAPTNAKAAGLYMICTLSKHKADAEGCDDSLMLDYRGQVAEATGANIFFLKDGVLHTPTPDCFLDGITRRTVIDLAHARDIEVIERAIMPEEMADFEQAFLTGTAAEVSPLREIGPYTFVVGNMVKALMDDYRKLVRREDAA